MHKVESAHEDGIWTCTWGTRVSNVVTDEPKDNELSFLETNKDVNSEETCKTAQSEKLTTQETVDFIVTGGVDDVVKIWDLKKDNMLKIRHELKGHSLGIISVAASSDGTSKFISLINKQTFIIKKIISIIYSYCQ